MSAYPAQGQDTKKIPISFLPPPLETATYSLGIYDAKTGKLVRRLQEGATTSAFTIGDNGLITSWDGKDDAGKPVPPGKYAARGYAVGALKIEGERILGNDWAADDENLRIKHIEAITLVPADNGVAVLAAMTDGNPAVLRFSGEGKLLWSKKIDPLPADAQPRLEISGVHLVLMPRPPPPAGGSVRSVATFVLDNGDITPLRVIDETVEEIPVRQPPLPEGVRMVTPSPVEPSTILTDPKLALNSGVRATPADPERSRVAGGGSWNAHSPGKDDTTWTAAGLAGLVQTTKDSTVLRRLEVAPGDPLPMAVSASTTEDRLYLLEERNGWQRMRGLSWVETKEENGKSVSTWQTVFERNIRETNPPTGSENPSAPMEISLMENPLLSAGKTAKLKLGATCDDHGSYLTTADGLRLRRIGQRASLKTARLTKGKAAGSLTFFQSDGAAWDEFSIGGARNMMEFDAGEFDMTVDGEKLHTEKPAEPPDL